MVGRLINIMMFVWGLLMFAVGVWANPGEPLPPAPALPLLLATVGPTQVILHDMRANDQRLVLVIHSSDVTSMPSRSELNLSFDVQITDVSKPRVPMPLRLETAVASKLVTFFFARDPFVFPQPWSYTVTIAFERLPHTGTVTFGSLPPQRVTYPASDSAGLANPRPGM